MNIYKIFVKPMVLLGLAVSLSSAMEPAKTKACPALTVKDIVHLIKGGFVTHGNMKFVMAKGDQENLPKLSNMDKVLNADPDVMPNIATFTADDTSVIDYNRPNENYRCQYRGDLRSNFFQPNPKKIHLQIVQFKGKEWLVDEKNPDKKMSPDEEEAYKLWLMDEYSEVPKDIKNIIGGKLLEMGRNPVLEGKISLFKDQRHDGMSRVNNEIEQTFTIKELLKPDGSLDLAKFNMENLQFIVTTNPDDFFQVRDDDLLYGIVLIAPKDVIAEKLSTTTKPFEVIMNEWDEKKAPIGIFSRKLNDPDLSHYVYLINKSIDEISTHDLWDLYKASEEFGIYGFGQSRWVQIPMSRYLFDFR